MLTTQAAVRRAFWADLDAMGEPDTCKPGKRQNNYSADVRTAWVEYVDMLARCGEITEELAQDVTL